MVTEKYNHAFIEKVNISQMQTLSSLEMIAQDYGWKYRCKCKPSLSLIMLSFSVQRGMLGEGSSVHSVPSPLML